MSAAARVLITGAGGQLGWELRRTAPAGLAVRAYDRADLDITSDESIATVVAEFAPTVIVNAAAYTAVDRAESERENAYAVNRDGARRLADIAGSRGARLIHLSTDFVFDGRACRPYRADDATEPLGVYGASKLAGEQAVRERLGEAALILRTAWVYSTHGHNFVKTMLRLMDQRDRLTVVADQVGTPTWARGLADAVWRAIAQHTTGVHHWTDAGVASWYDFAVAIQEEALALDLLRRAIPIAPVATAEYPTPAARPSYSVLDKEVTWAELGVKPPHWRVALRAMLREQGAHKPAAANEAR